MESRRDEEDEERVRNTSDIPSCRITSCKSFNSPFSNRFFISTQLFPLFLFVSSSFCGSSSNFFYRTHHLIFLFVKILLLLYFRMLIITGISTGPSHMNSRWQSWISLPIIGRETTQSTWTHHLLIVDQLLSSNPPILLTFVSSQFNPWNSWHWLIIISSKMEPLRSDSNLNWRLYPRDHLPSWIYTTDIWWLSTHGWFRISNQNLSALIIPVGKLRHLPVISSILIIRVRYEHNIIIMI